MRKANAFFRAGDLEALLDLYHPDAEWRDLQHGPDTPEPVHGRAARWRDGADCDLPSALIGRSSASQGGARRLSLRRSEASIRCQTR